jgi:hypothetical protein
MTLKWGFCVAPKILGKENLILQAIQERVRSRRKTRRKRIPTRGYKSQGLAETKGENKENE